MDGTHLTRRRRAADRCAEVLVGKLTVIVPILGAIWYASNFLG